MVNLVKEITGNDHGAITMNIDNMLVINRAKNLITHVKSKHIEIKFHYLQEHVAKGNMNLEPIELRTRLYTSLQREYR